MTYGGFDLSGKVAFVTGASRGIGRAIALGLAECGADLFLCSRTLPDLQAVAREVRTRGRKAEVAAVDVGSVESIQAGVGAALRSFGQIDILVNNAGINTPLPALEETEDNFDEHVAVNLKGLFFCAQAVGRTMVSRRAGKIINVSSTLGVVGAAPRSVYSMTKGGVTLLTKALALEWAPFNVHVNAIGPTLIRTDLTRFVQDDPVAYQRMLAKIPLGRAGEVQDVVGAAIYLASPASDL
ncbi:MAG: SDR family NAD(P)-dependent oxidoreductase, partial [candidate division NC10 bacterium]|nr:SDR family NAD(P)-dependent oxidoreductase [candidate division NC10 bacterium]